MENFGAQQHLFRKSTTYLAKIAVVLQDAPDKMLTFTQLMDKLTPLISEERKSVENNIRVCLSTNKCFVKIPVVPDSLDSKRNYWKLDPSQITAKMVRRHFKGILQLFPELASKVEMETTSRPSEHCSASARSSPMCSTGGSTHQGLAANGAAKPIKKRMHVYTEASFPVYTRASAAPYFSSPHSSYITYSVPTFTHDALRFWL
ncbi:Forkhead box protein H1 [Larimichthys crocea]|uniref:Uncharacterized protein n=1 Tax=Larimichthys crocea TaxID=215358 RepID=A0ACD3RJ36_LARCR|nr:Forkhead box protein H1 [Larimichthys crocea]